MKFRQYKKNYLSFFITYLTFDVTMCELSTTQREKASVTNQKWVLASRPEGYFDPEKDAKLVADELILDCKEDEIVVETDTLSVDAFIRTMLDEEAYHGSVPLGGTLPAFGYGRVVRAGTKAKFKVGSVVTGMLGAQTHAVVKAAQAFSKVDLPFASPTAALGLTGLTTGLTAYAGVFYVCDRPRRGETVVVTGASGAVGSVAAQLAKSCGARVIGTAGGSDKQNFLVNELGLDGSIDYKHPTRSVSDQLQEYCPDGVDFVYDNVGGEILDDLLSRINPKGRVVVCGAASQYSGNLNKGLVRGPSNYLKLAERGATMKGFNVMQYMSRIMFAVFWMWWLSLRGKVIMKEHVEHGIDTFPLALSKLFNGGHIGKMLVNVKKSKID